MNFSPNLFVGFRVFILFFLNKIYSLFLSLKSNYHIDYKKIVYNQNYVQLKIFTTMQHNS
jgi:hypothetical protein